DLTPERLGEIIDLFEAGKGASVTPGPQNGRFYSAPLAGLTTLKDETPLLKANRDEEARVPAGAVRSEAAASLPPSNAAKPRTRAAVTDSTLKSPSPKKSDAATEDRASATAPAHDPIAANTAGPQVEAADKQRKRKSGDTGIAAAKAPELLHGEPLGPTGKRVKGDPAAPEGKLSPESPGNRKPGWMKKDGGQ
ncbi:MAG: NADH-quinone oxidoreductase subunit E, partial [Pseudaminobacter sp.]|nr:NADH-quinone oxidoreductase subunit E [Pseudaminobacter sp.]